jgi:hypothetical protein
MRQFELEDLGVGIDAPIDAAQAVIADAHAVS